MNSTFYLGDAFLGILDGKILNNFSLLGLRSFALFFWLFTHIFYIRKIPLRKIPLIYRTLQMFVVTCVFPGVTAHVLDSVLITYCLLGLRTVNSRIGTV